jgi:hypothetical protein
MSNLLGRTTGTHTYALLEVPKMVYDDIRKRLEDAGYQHAFDQSDGRDVIDMSGIGITEAPIAEQSREMKEALAEFEIGVLKQMIVDLGDGLEVHGARMQLERRIEAIRERAKS